MSTSTDFETVYKVIAWAMASSGLKPADLISEFRYHPLPRWRHTAMYVCRKRTKLTYTEIGRLFGNRHRNTVLYAVHNVERHGAGEQLLARFDKWTRRPMVPPIRLNDILKRLDGYDT